MDWKAVRGEFPILDQQIKGQPLIYFDNAATSQKPKVVIEALTRYYEQDNANVHRGLHALSNRATDQYEQARARAAQFLGAAGPDQIVFTRGTTEGLNLLANTVAPEVVGRGDTILITEMEHHSNIVPWQMAAERLGADLQWIPLLDDGTLDLEAAKEIFSTKAVKLFSCTHVSNSLGTINPVKDLVALARSSGALSIVDGAQSAGCMPVSVEDLGCDFFVFSGHKICAPTGIGTVYARGDLWQTLRPWQGGGEMIHTVLMDHSDYKKGPARFEAGTPPIGNAIVMATAMDFLDEIGRQRIWEHDQELVKAARAALDDVPGLQCLGPSAEVERGPLWSFAIDDIHPHDIVTLVDEKGLALRGGHHCTQPVMRRMGVPSSTRCSFSFYNTEEEIGRMGEILRGTTEFFQIG